jgi:hypothetical protein
MAQIGPVGGVDRGRHRNDEKIDRPEPGLVAGQFERGALKVGSLDLTGPVLPRVKFLDPPGIDVKSDHRAAGTRERCRHGQADITQTNNGNLPAV